MYHDGVVLPRILFIPHLLKISSVLNTRPGFDARRYRISNFDGRQLDLLAVDNDLVVYLY